MSAGALDGHPSGRIWPPGLSERIVPLRHRDPLVTVWGAGYGDDTQVLRAHIANLRRKLDGPAGRTGKHGASIRTDAGVGYRFAA